MNVVFQIKRIIFLVLIFIFTEGCSQVNDKKENINYTEKVKNIYKEVKVYDYNPTYQLKINTILCTYEVYINDVLVDYSFSVGRTAGEQNIDIPQYILKSGKQSVRIKIYPNAIENGILENLINKNTVFSARIVYGEYYKESFENFKEVFRYDASKVKDKDKLPFIEFVGEFETKVPYELKGWTDGVDLSKEDPKKLEEEVWIKMEEIKKLYENKDIEGIAELRYKSLLDYYKSMYYNNPKESEDWINKTKETLEENYKYVLDKKRSQLFIMGNGKLVTVLQVGKHNYRNDSAFLGISKESYNFFEFYFYRPKEGMPLEVIL